MEDKDAEVRKTAIKYVASIGKKLAFVTMVDALEEEKDTEVRGIIADNLLKMDMPASIRQVWVDALKQKGEENKTVENRVKLRKVIERIKKANIIIKTLKK